MNQSATDLLTAAEVSAMVRLDRSTIFRLRRKGQFPPPVDRGVRTNVWRRADIEAWLDRRRNVAA